MRFTITLDLGNFIQRLPLHPGLGVITINTLSIQAFHGEHQTIGKVTVVRNSHNPATGFGFVIGHPFPQVFRVHRLVRAEGNDF